MNEECIGIIGGTGLGDVFAELLTDVVMRRPRTPFGRTSGTIMVGRLGHRRIAYLNRHGAGHRYHPATVPYAANIFAMKKLGVTTLISSGAVGSLRREIEPTHLVLVEQFIDKTWRRQNTFFDEFGAVHCELDQPCCPRLRRILKKTARHTKAVTHEEGTYICMEGPQFSTRAESLMHQAWGGDLIGMTAMPEAKLAREAQMCYALIALVSDYDCWKPHPKGMDKHDLLKEILSHVQTASKNAVELIQAVMQSDLPLCDDTCSCRKSLEMAVWTQPKTQPADIRKQLAPLFD